MKKLSIAFGLLLILGALLACGEASNNTGVAASNSGGNTPAPVAKHFKVGDTVQVGNTWKVVVNGIKTDPGSDYDKPKDGNIFLEIDISMTNISNAEQNASSLLDWSFTDSTGQKYDSTVVSGAPSAPDGKVEAGQPLRGTLAYEVPTAQKAFVLAFAPDITSGGQTIWDLSI